MTTCCDNFLNAEHTSEALLNRRSRPQVCFKIGVLKNFTIFDGKPVLESPFNKISLAFQAVFL